MLSTTMTLSGALFLSFFKLQACSLFTAKSSKVLLLSIDSKTRCDVCYCHSWFSLMEVTPDQSSQHNRPASIPSLSFH